MPAELTTFVDIDATPERVWQVLTDLPAYAEWNPFIAEADRRRRRRRAAVGPRAAGQRVRRGRHCGPPSWRWSPAGGCGCGAGSTGSPYPGLFDVELTWTISDHDGGVRLWQQDQFGGLLAPLLFRSLNRHRLAAFNAMNAALKQRVEGT